jgi:hypothetical protein
VRSWARQPKSTRGLMKIHLIKKDASPEAWGARFLEISKQIKHPGVEEWLNLAPGFETGHLPSVSRIWFSLLPWTASIHPAVPPATMPVMSIAWRGIWKTVAFSHQGAFPQKQEFRVQLSLMRMSAWTYRRTRHGEADYGCGFQAF